MSYYEHHRIFRNFAVNLKKYYYKNFVLKKLEMKFFSLYSLFHLLVYYKIIISYGLLHQMFSEFTNAYD